MNTFQILKNGINFHKPPPKLDVKEKIEEVKEQQTNYQEKEAEIEKKIIRCQQLLSSTSPVKEGKVSNLQKIYEQLVQKKLALVNFPIEIVNR